MATSKTLVSKLMTSASVAIANTLGDQEIAAAMAVFGFSAERMTECQALLNGGDAAVSAQVAAVGEWKAACARSDAAEETAHTAFQGLAQSARGALGRDRAALATLGLDRPMPRTTAEFITMAMALFDNVAANPAIAARLERYGYTAERTTSERAKVLALIDAVRAKEAAKGAAQQATAAQSAAMAALRDEIGAFRRVAKVALKGKPQLLEKLGIVARSARTAAQRGAGKKAAATRKAKKSEKLEPVGA